jgi:hypothetical protein
MIHVDQKPEPADFDEEVREPGLAFLKSRSGSGKVDWKGREYWRLAIPHLRKAYSSICAYTCHWISVDTGSQTVEHFLPKSKHSDLAYDWANYRLVCSRMNGRKGDHEDVLDPFLVRDGMFQLIFPAMLVRPCEDLSSDEKEAVEKTIARLKLNDDETSVRARLRYVLLYCSGDITLRFLGQHAPFIAKELARQGLEDTAVLSGVMGQT